jgi:ADP-ribose pyrophosphatase
MIKRLEEVLEHANSWLRLYVDRVRFPNGDEGRYNRVVTGKGFGGVGILPLSVQGRIALVNIFRYPIGQSEWELPRGMIGEENNAEDDARRELYEETGLAAEQLDLIGTFFPNTGVTTTRMHI